VTADVACQFTMNDQVLSRFDGHYHVLPPLRGDEDRF